MNLDFNIRKFRQNSSFKNKYNGRACGIFSKKITASISIRFLLILILFDYNHIFSNSQAARPAAVESSKAAGLFSYHPDGVSYLLSPACGSVPGGKSFMKCSTKVSSNCFPEQAAISLSASS